MTYEIRENYYALYLAGLKQLRPEHAFARMDNEKEKQRIKGRQDIPIAVMFDDRCKRFYMESDRRALVKDYGWQGVE